MNVCAMFHINPSDNENKVVDQSTDRQTLASLSFFLLYKLTLMETLTVYHWKEMSQRRLILLCQSVVSVSTIPSGYRVCN